MLYLIDADTPAFAAAAMAEGQSEQIAKWNVNQGIEHLLARLNATEFQLFVTGEDNFRYKVYPEYKANRINTPRPEFLAATKQHLIDEWGAVESNGCEADDLLGVEQMAQAETCIVSIDKDLDMIPGWHFRPAIMRLGVEVSPERRYLMSPVDATRFFYYQLLVGDPTDNIKGAKGIGPVKAAKILEGLTDELDLYKAAKGFYNSQEELEQNAKCLWIWRKHNDDITERFKELDTQIEQEQREEFSEQSAGHSAEVLSNA